jgi:hypothetical protein
MPPATKQTATAAATETDPTKWTAGSDTPKVEFVLIDYNGTVGSAPSQTEVKHERSPFVANLFDTKLTDLVLQPGLNLSPAGTWGEYSKRESTVLKLLERGQLKQLSKLPEDEEQLQRLIERTISRGALDYIEAAVMKQAVDADRRTALLASINYQRANRSVVDIEPRLYVQITNDVEGLLSNGQALGNVLTQLIQNALVQQQAQAATSP